MLRAGVFVQRTSSTFVYTERGRTDHFVLSTFHFAAVFRKIQINFAYLHGHGAQSHTTHLILLFCITQSALPAAVFAVMEKA